MTVQMVPSPKGSNKSMRSAHLVPGGPHDPLGRGLECATPGDAFLGILLECVGISVAAHKAAVFLLQGSAAGAAGDGEGGHVLVDDFGAGWD